MELLGPLAALSFVLAPVILPVSAVVALVWYSRRTERRRLGEAQEGVAEAWSLVETFDPRGPSWLGHRHDQPVRITWSNDRLTTWTELRVGSDLAPRWLVDPDTKVVTRILGLVDLVDWAAPPEGGLRVRTGDPVFDRHSIGGPASHALAVLGDDATRRAVAGDLAAQEGADELVASVRDGTLVVWLPHTCTSPSELEPILRRAAQLARRLDLEDDEVIPRLDRHARTSSVPGVRIACLQALIDIEAATGRIKPFLEAPNPRMRLLAARHLGAVDALIELVAEREAKPAVSVEALRALEAHPTAAPRAVAVALERSEPVLLAAAADLAGATRSEEALSSLVRLLDGPLRDWGEGEGWADVRPVALALARALGRVGGAEAELLLIALLDAPSNEVRIEAMRSLGRVGSVTAVLPILDHAERPFPAVRRAARQAVAAIQERAGGEAGSLSLAQDQPARGAVTLAREGGELELAEDGDSPDGEPHQP